MTEKELKEQLEQNQKQMKYNAEELVMGKAAMKTLIVDAPNADVFIKKAAEKIYNCYTMTEYYQKEINNIQNQLSESEAAAKKEAAKEKLGIGGKN